MKKSTKLISLVLALGMTLGFVGCGGADNTDGIKATFPTGGNSDSAQTLDVYLLYKGYGDDWLVSGLNRFWQEDWVKAKYPNLSINYTRDGVDTTAHQKLSAGPSINKYDLLFGVNLQGYEGRLLADLTDSVYLAEVPGETGVRVIDKIPERVLSKVNWKGAPARADGNDSYYVTSYIQGMFGMLYNADLLEAMSLEVPVTTDQFLSTCATIKSTGYTSSAMSGKNNCVIMNASEDNYWDASFDIWWAQYEGVEGYENYFRGYDAAEEVEGSSVVLDQVGRLESLKVIENTLKNYAYKNAHSVDFEMAQTEFLMGGGVFHFNGDYFATEMQSTIKDLNKRGISYDIQYMKMPVISSIIDRTPSIETDAVLQAIIKDIDANKAYKDSQAAAENNVTAEDYAIIVEARGICTYSAANSQSAVVPSYAPAKALAADFLRYMYTDESIKDFTKSSGGVLFPSTYDVLNDAELMESVQPIHKSKMELMKGSSNCEFKYLPSADSTFLGKGGLTSLHFDGKFEVYFTQGVASYNAAAILAAEKDHWSISAWDQMVAAARGAGA